MSGLFGALDTTQIPEIMTDGTHPFILRSITPFHSDNSGNDFIKFNFELSDQTSPFYRQQQGKVTKWIRVYTDMDQEKFNDLDDEERRKVIQNINYAKTWFKSLKVPESELDDPDFSVLTGMEGLAYGFSKDGYNGGPREWVLFSFKPY